jgi:hypothetical protein
MSPIIDILVVSALLSAAPPQELTLQQVVKANTAAINAIRSIHVTIEVSNNYPVPGEESPPTEPQPTWTYEWYKDGTRERVRQHLLRGKGPHSYDASNGPKGYKVLHNYDPSNPPSESSASRAGGEIDKMRTDDALGGSVRASSYIAPFPVERGTLEAYVKKYPDSKLAETPATSKLDCYEITTIDEKSLGSGSIDVRDVRVFVDPKAGFWIRRIEKGPWQKSTDPGDKGTFIGEVQEFKDCGNGIFWPLRIYQSTRLPGRSIGLETSIRHTLHSVNQSLSDEDFEVRFPDWLVVHDKTSGQVFVWGLDNKPRMTFPSQVEFVEWDKPRMQNAARTGGAPQRTRWIWLAGISVFVGLLLIFTIIRRRKNISMGGGMSQATEQT